jgi:hypothetical protein
MQGVLTMPVIGACPSAAGEETLSNLWRKRIFCALKQGAERQLKTFVQFFLVNIK